MGGMKRIGTITIPGSPLRLDDNIWSGGRSTHLPPPGLGEHSDAIRAECKAHFMWIHHSGKDQARGARGHRPRRGEAGGGLHARRANQRDHRGHPGEL